MVYLAYLPAPSLVGTATSAILPQARLEKAEFPECRPKIDILSAPATARCDADGSRLSIRAGLGEAGTADTFSARQAIMQDQL